VERLHYANIDELVEACWTESGQLEAFARYIETDRTLRASLAIGAWGDVERRYNGAAMGVPTPGGSRLLRLISAPRVQGPRRRGAAITTRCFGSSAPSTSAQSFDWLRGPAAQPQCRWVRVPLGWTALGGFETVRFGLAVVGLRTLRAEAIFR
jgi:hypothetical protein